VALFSDTIRQLESVASANLVPQTDVDLLTGAYRAYRASIHRLSLDGASAIVPAQQFREARAGVTALWESTMNDEPAGARV
jgi:glutamate-ammonia-ligase adenylyltransferase